MTRRREPGEVAVGHSVVSGGSGSAKGLAVLVRARIVGAERPDRSIRRVAALARFGPTLAGSFAAATARSPDRIAVIDERRRLSYAELDTRVRRIAGRLAEFGVGADGSVAVLQRNSAYTIETLVAISRLGADAVLLNIAMSAEQIGAVLAREQPKVLIADADLLAELVADPSTGVVAGVGSADRVVVIADGSGGPSKADLSLDQLADNTAPEAPAPRTRGKFVVLT